MRGFRNPACHAPYGRLRAPVTSEGLWPLRNRSLATVVTSAVKQFENIDFVPRLESVTVSYFQKTQTKAYFLQTRANREGLNPLRWGRDSGHKVGGWTPRRSTGPGGEVDAGFWRGTVCDLCADFLRPDCNAHWRGNCGAEARPRKGRLVHVRTSVSYERALYSDCIGDLALGGNRLHSTPCSLLSAAGADRYGCIDWNSEHSVSECYAV